MQLHDRMQCQDMALKTGKSGPSSLKLCSIPPTTEAFTENVNRCHLKVAIWKAALIESPREMDSTKYGWELDHLDNMVPRTVPSGTLSAPPDILQLIHCNCKASGYRTAACIAARKLGARFYVYVRVRKPVKILWRVARRKMNPSRLLRTQMMMICDETMTREGGARAKLGFPPSLQPSRPQALHHCLPLILCKANANTS